MDILRKIIYLSAMLLEIFIRMPYDRRRRKVPKTDQRISSTERSLFGALFVTMLLLPLLDCLTPWLRFADFRWRPATRARASGAGTALLALAIWLFWRSHRDLDINWSPSLEISTKQTLVTQGVYRVIRHPMYASQLAWGLGQPLLLQNWLSGFGGLAVFALVSRLRVPQEEQMMLDHFGDEYRAYAARTGRFVPRLTRR